MKTLLLVFTILSLGACSHGPLKDVHAQMHEHFFEPASLVRNVQSADSERNDHVPDRQRLGQLKGLRIALDPGHIGGSPWDARNGKQIYNSRGEQLSEGLLALELSYLLEHELRNLGAEVFVDRGDLAPVTAHAYDDFADTSHVFFQRLDLDARAERLWAFHPDITLILHFDADRQNLDEAKSFCNDTKAYVPGAFMREDMNDEVERAFVKIAWRNPAVWDESLALSRAIVGQIHSRLGVPLATKTAGHTGMIEPGVFARSLRLQRHMAGYITSFVESFCYEDPDQFQALLKNREDLTISGKPYTYSPRLRELADAIRDGVMAYVGSHVLSVTESGHTY